MSDDPFSGFDLPVPPPGLREDALRAARAAVAVRTRPDPWTRLLANRRARFAWAATVLLLAAANVLVPASPAPPVSRPAAGPPLEPEVAAIAHLPRIEDRALAALTGERS